MRLITMAALLLAAAATNAGETLAQQYPGPWHRDMNVPIARTLSEHQVRNCGDMPYRPNPKQHDEFLVYCSADDGIWRAYLVWPGIGKLMGPYPVDPTVPAPKPLLDLSSKRAAH